jgi:hypothetical protein
VGSFGREDGKKSHVTILPPSAKLAQGLPLQPRQATALFSELPGRNTILRGHSVLANSSFHPSACIFYSNHHREHISHTMSQSPLTNTNFINGNYPFMDHAKGALPIPPPPSKYPKGVPSANYIHSQKPPSLPGSQPPSPSSMPQYPAQMVSSYSTSSTSSTSSSSPGSSPPSGIFTIFRPDGRRTPELPDILSTKKKSTWNQK